MTLPYEAMMPGALRSKLFIDLRAARRAGRDRDADAIAAVIAQAGAGAGKAVHKQRLWSALHAHQDMQDQIRRIDSASLLDPNLGKPTSDHEGEPDSPGSGGGGGGGGGPPSPGGKKKQRGRQQKDTRTSSVVSERIYMALQRNGARSTLEIDDLLLFVSQIHPLRLLPERVRRFICEKATLRKFSPGEVICKQGDDADAFYVILTGAVEVYREPPEDGLLLDEGGSSEDDDEEDDHDGEEEGEEEGGAGAGAGAEAEEGPGGGGDSGEAPNGSRMGGGSERGSEGGSFSAQQQQQRRPSAVSVASAKSVASSTASGGGAAAGARAEEKSEEQQQEGGGGHNAEDEKDGAGSEADGTAALAPSAAGQTLDELMKGGGGGGGDGDGDGDEEEDGEVEGGSLGGGVPATTTRKVQRVMIEPHRPIPSELFLAQLIEGEGFGHAALTDDVCARLRNASCRSSATHMYSSCMCVTHEMYLEAQNLHAMMEEEEANGEGSGASFTQGHGGAGGSLVGGTGRQSLSVRKPKRRSTATEIGALAKVAAGAKDGNESSMDDFPEGDLPGMTPLQEILSTDAQIDRLIAGLALPAEMRSLLQLRAAGQLVQATKFFNGLDPADCEAIGRKLKSHHTVENQVVVETGDNADRFYLVLRGQLQVLVNGLVVTSKGPAHTFGEMALVGAAEKRTADVVAIGACDLVSLHRDDYLQIVQQKQQSKAALKLSVIRSNPLFRDCLTAAQQEAFASRGQVEHYEGGEAIVRQGDSAEKMFLLLRGSCEVHRVVTLPDGRQGKKLRINLLHKGQLFGEVGVLLGVARTATVVADVACECLVMARIDLMRFFFECPELRQVLLDASDAYLPDEDLLRTWREDEQWRTYKAELRGSLLNRPPMSKRPDKPEPIEFWSLPTHKHPPEKRPDPHAAASGGGGSASGEPGADGRENKLHVWASEYLDKFVLPGLESLIVNEPYPVMPPSAAPAAAPALGGKSRRASTRGGAGASRRGSNAGLKQPQPPNGASRRPSNAAPPRPGAK